MTAAPSDPTPRNTTMSERITWTRTRLGSGEEGRAGGIHLFGIHYGTKRQDEMWALSTTLPISHPSLGQKYPTPTHAKVAAERLLAAFLAKVDTPATTKEAGDDA